VNSGENSGDIYEQVVVKTVAGFFRGNPKHLFGVTRFGALVVYMRVIVPGLSESIQKEPRLSSRSCGSGHMAWMRVRLLLPRMSRGTRLFCLPAR